MSAPGRSEGKHRGVQRDGAARRAQGGAALLLAMLILSLVATVASAMAWHQYQAIEVETAERARTQAAWILNGALDWARLILREDARSGGADHLGEPWAVPLAEARLSTFLAADQDNNTDSGLDAFLSGAITDVQARYNLRRLVSDEGKPVAAEVAALARLCDAAGVAGDVAGRLAEGLVAALAGAGNAPLLPTRVGQLVWLGLDAETVARLTPFVVLLPVRTAVNTNTAPREVLVAAIDGLDLGSAERIVQARQRSPFKSVQDLRAQLPQGVSSDDSRAGVSTRFFEVAGRLRLGDRVLEERSMLERVGADRSGEVVVRQRERHMLQSPG